MLYKYNLFTGFLDLDSSRWKLDDDISQSRHMTFWQLYVTEVMAVKKFLSLLSSY